MIPILIFAAAIATQAPQDTTRLTVATAVDRALATHPSVAAARAQRDVAAAEVGQARAAWLPALSLDGAINRFELPMVVYPLHSLDLRNPPEFDRSLSQASVGAAYTLLDFGARRSKVKAAEAGREAASATLDASEQQMVARTANAYLRVLTSRGVLAAQDERIAALAAELKRSRDRLAVGKAASVDTMRAAAELASAAAERIS
ncbi:MAG: TolC family protein, partial [Gemmatimonadetes bacterium]|nr:TolC family protein [Gemmatimonadota bacterium]